VRIYPERAALLLMQMAEEKGWEAGPYINIAELLKEAEQQDMAIRFLRTAISLSPDNDRAYELFLEIDPARMEDLAAAAAQEHPTSAKAWHRLAQAKLDAGDKAGAFEAFKRSAELGHSNVDDIFREMIRCDASLALPAIRAIAKQNDEESQGLLGHAFVANGLVDEAYDTYIRAHSLDPDDVTWLRCLVEIDPTRAASVLRQTIASYDGSGKDEIVGARGNALRRLGHDAAAFEEYSAALEIDDDDWEWMQGIAASDPRRAATVLEKKLEGNPDSRNIKGALADAYAGMGRGAEAAELYRQILENDSAETRWKISYAQVDPAAGIAILKKDVDAEPDDDYKWGALGDALRRLGRTAEAREAYSKAREIDPADWRWHTRLKELP
jgi:tetratricopeptide (TPR) repeat protein